MSTMHGLIMVLTMVISSYGKLTCIGDDGNPVDMYVLYKLPRIHKYDVPALVHDGHGYAYLDSTDFKFKLSDSSIASEKSAAARTLDQVYKAFNASKNYPHEEGACYQDGPDDQAHVFFNDEDPAGKEYFDNGHTKGAVAFDKESGFWLITSVPKYPPAAADGYSYPHSGCMYGQMFMCVTFSSSSFNDIGLQLRYNTPHVHSCSLPSDWEETFPNFKSLVDGDMMTDPPHYRNLSLKSLGGVDYEHFAKSGEYHKDLYRDFVAPTFQADILTETWQHGHNINSSCETQFTVEDIKDLNVDLPVQKFPFDNYKDHSKFVVGKTASKPYVCVGDINRQPTQYRRGGGTMCTKNVDLWKQFFQLIVDINQCPSKRVV